MRKIIVKLGLVKSVLAITVSSSLTSALVTLLIVVCCIRLGMEMDIFQHLIVATLVPIFLAPPLSWLIIDLFLKIDQLEVEMRQAATIDSLTGLMNRRTFMERASYIFYLAQRDYFGFSVLVVDLDHFKSINDQFGHASGDRVLATFGKVAGQVTRKSDLAGRLGGEEFAFILPHTSAEQAWDFAARLHEAIENTAAAQHDFPIRFTVSIGIAAYPKDGLENLEKLLSLADKAMYLAKQNGRNQSAIYNEGYKILEMA